MGSAGSLILLVSVDAATLFLSGLLLYRSFGIYFCFDITNNTRALSWSGFVGSTYITCCFIWTIITGSSLHSSRCRYSKQNVKVLESHISSSPNMGSRIGKYHFSVWSLCEWLVSARAEKRKQPHMKKDPYNSFTHDIFTHQFLCTLASNTNVNCNVEMRSGKIFRQ